QSIEPYAPTPEGGLRARTGGPQDPATIAAITAAKAGETEPPAGYRKTATGYEYIPGGPQDPEQIMRVAKAKLATGMTDRALNIDARRLIAGDLSVLQNRGHGVQGQEEINQLRNRANDILVEEMGKTEAEAADFTSSQIQKFKASQIGQSAEARTAGTREANLN